MCSHLRLAPRALSRQGFSTSTPKSILPLAYQLHEPPNGGSHNGPAIVFMHGLFGSKQNNRSLSKALARDLNLPIYAVDLRNHGDSPHDLRHDYIAMAEDVEGFMEDQSLIQPILIGHSMGAKVAMSVALRNPSNISALIAVDNSPADAALKSDFGKYIRGMRAVEDAKVTKQLDADVILQKYEEALPIRQFLLTNLTRSPNTNVLKFRIPTRVLASSLDHMADFPFRDPEKVRYEGPALFVRGTKSHYVADETLPLIGRFFPRFELLDIDSGHWVISERPTEFRKGVVDFLRRKAAS